MRTPLLFNASSIFLSHLIGCALRQAEAGEASQAAGDGPPIKPFTAVVMNLPATAIEFLDVFRLA